MSSPIMNVLRNFLLELNYIQHDQEIDEKDSLLEKGLIDSVGMVELVAFLEETYGIKVDEDDLMPENFDSLESIESFVRKKVEQP